jgi:hypothetical protein
VNVNSGRVLFASERTPLIVAGEGTVLFWQPQDWYEPSSAVMRRCQIGGTAPYAVVARWLNGALRANGSPAVEDIPLVLPVTAHVWHSGGVRRALLGNLETGISGDSRIERTVRIGTRAIVVPSDGHCLIDL